MSIEAKQATPHWKLISELMDSCVPKTEREHAAAREIERLRAAITEASMPLIEPPGRCRNCLTYNGHQDYCEYAIAEASGQQAIEMRAPKAGDRVVCIEDGSAGTVEFTSAAGGPYIKFDDGSYGQWSLHQFGDLFCYATPPRSEWAGLTDEEVSACMMAAYDRVQGRNLELAFARAIEAKLKEKNGG